MNISQSGIDLIKHYESFRADAYLDGGGVPTIGWGTTYINGKPVQLGMTCTEAQATDWLTADCQRAVSAVSSLVKRVLTQDQFDALVDFVYNVGETNFKISHLLSAVNQGNWEEAQRQILRWNHDHGEVVKGLTRRRLSEAELLGPHSREELISLYKLDV